MIGFGDDVTVLCKHVEKRRNFIYTSHTFSNLALNHSFYSWESQIYFLSHISARPIQFNNRITLL